MSTHTDVPHLHAGDSLEGLLKRDSAHEEAHNDWVEREEELRRRACRFVAAEGVKYLEAQHGCTGRGCVHRNHRRDVDWVKRKMELPQLLDALGILGPHVLADVTEDADDDGATLEELEEEDW